MSAQREIFDDATMQSQRDDYAAKAVYQHPLDMRDNSVFARVGDVAIVRGSREDIPVVITHRRRATAILRGFGQKEPPRIHWNISKLWVPRFGYGPRGHAYATLHRARITPDKDQRWLVDTHTGEMIRVANLYDVWILENAFYNQLAAVRRRFKLVDGAAWMTGT